MLVLTRKRDEAIVIHDRFGTEIRLTVVEIRGNKVRLGIEAPLEVSISREEVRQRDPANQECVGEMACV
jgi:carbon storage regulator